MAAPPSGPRRRAPAAPMHPFYTRAATMIGEIAAAVSFISKFLRTKGLTSERQLQTFSQSLQELLAGERAAVGGRGVPGGFGPHSPGPGRRGRGSLAGLRAGSARFPSRDRDWRAWRPLSAGSGEGLGAGPRAPPLPKTGKQRGEENRRTTKKLKPTEPGAAVLGPCAYLGTKEGRGWDWFRAPSPQLPPTVWSSAAGPGWETAPLSRSQPGTDVPSPWPPSPAH